MDGGSSQKPSLAQAIGEGAAPVGVLVMYHGTPGSMDDVAEFYTEIRRGNPPTPELLSDLKRRYRAIGGLSPLRERTEAQVSCIRRALDAKRPGRFVVAAGAKHASPRIADALAVLSSKGVKRCIAVVLAPHSSKVSVGEYSRIASEAARVISVDRPERRITVEQVDHWHLEPALIAALEERVRKATVSLDPEKTVVLFTAHSVPLAVAESGDSYEEQVTETAKAVAAGGGVLRWRVAWQSAGRSGGQWLGPDILVVIDELAAGGADAVVVCPVGFVSDHLEILYDLDIEAAARARGVGLEFRRTASLNDDPLLCEAVASAVIGADEN